MTYTLNIKQDEMPINPYDDRDMFGTMYHWHRRGFFGTDCRAEGGPAYLAQLEGEGALVVPVYLYEHSGQTIRSTPFSCPWDSGQVGAWVATPEQIKEEFDGDVEKARACILAQIKEMDQFLTGDVWGYEILDDEGEHVESCWGLFGEDSCREEGKRALQALNNGGSQ